MTDPVILKRDPPLAEVIINKPDSLNAISDGVLNGIRDCCVEITDDESLDVMILRGAEDNFSAGRDMDALQDDNQSRVTTKFKGTLKTQEMIESMPVPTIAAIEGYGLGGGLELAVCHDFRVAADEAILGFPEIDVGIFPGGGGTQRVSRLIGVPATKEMMFSGEKISAQQADEIGLVDHVFPQSDFDVELRAFAERFVNKPPIAIQACKESINQVWRGKSFEEGMLFESVSSELVFDTEDKTEGMNAFSTDTEPDWRGY